MSTLSIPTARSFLPLLTPGRYLGASGGRAAAKSHFFAELMVETAYRRPVRAVCIREVQKSLDESVKKLLEDKIDRFKVGRDFIVQSNRIITPHGTSILFQGMQNHTNESIKSLEGIDIAWVEEAQTLSQPSLDKLRPTIRKPGSQIWFSWNPKFKTDPVDAFFRENASDADFRHVHVTFRDNPWLPEEMLKEVERDKRRDPDKYAHIWLGDYQRNSEARVFRNWRIGDPEEFITGATTVYLYGCDFGFAIDPTVAIRCYIVGRTLFVDREVYKVGCEIDHTPALFDKLDDGQMREWPALADSARPETISYLNRNGYPRIKAARKGAGSVEEGVEFLKTYDIVVHPNCTHTIDELTFYSYKIDRVTEEVLPILADKKNHVIDSVRYAVEKVRRSGTYDQTMGWVE